MDQNKTEMEKRGEWETLLDKLRVKFADKWVEHVVFWLIVLIATAIAGAIVKNYIVAYFIKP